MLSSLLTVLTTFAAPCKPKGIQIFPTWYQYLEGKIDSTGRCSPQFAFPDDSGAILLALVDIMLRVGAIIAVGYVIYGGVQYIISQGEPDKTTNARKTIQNALIGLVIASLATVIVTLVGRQLT